MKQAPANLVVIMPCKNEADNIAEVIKNIQKLKPSQIYIGLDPSTTDATREVAEKLGCTVALADRGGYDPAVYAATKIALRHHPNSILLYTDAGGKYGYAQVGKMVSLMNSGVDMVLAVRTDTNKTMLWHQKLGTKLVLAIINLLTRKQIRDISPFRLVKSTVFNTVQMEPKKFRWPSELLVKALASGLVIQQVNVISLPRIGTSKVSGSVINSLRAGIEMVSSIGFIYTNKQRRSSAYVTDK